MPLNYARDVLPFVQKPSRYLGNEVNSIRKDLSYVRTRVALAFPDSYEVGMSHNGIRILYHLLNARQDVAAERVFLPWTDFEEILRRRSAPLATLESRRPVREFHILGISLLYELAATNVVLLLDLSGIPRRAADRRREDPLVVAGGPVAFNVEPMAPFFDAVVLGDGEEIFPEIVEAHEAWHRSGAPREALLERLECLQGVYVPSRYEVEHGSDGRVRGFRHASGHRRPVLARLLEDLDHSPHPTAAIVPYTQVVHDRVTLEVQRGCTRGCRFCHAGTVYRPVRDRDPWKVLELAEESLRRTGYEEISLSSLCIADYRPLKGLVPRMMERLAPLQTSISLPSLRVGALSPDLLAQIARVRRTGFTLVPEAGSERLRNVINKVLTEADLRRNLQDILDAGWPGVKFYFMLGLPTETFDDLRELADMLMACARMRARETGERFRFINVSLSTFVPKPHTPFQWYPQDRRETIEEKLDFIKRHVPDRRIRLHWSNPRHSFLEAVISKGDRRLAGVIEEAVDRGCKFDGWMEFFDFDKWMEAFASRGLDPEWYAYREIPVEEPLPWDHLDPGVTKDYQRAEWERALREVTVGDCRYESCGQCGILDNYRGVKYHYAKPIPPPESALPLVDLAPGQCLAANALAPGVDAPPSAPVELSLFQEQAKNGKATASPRPKGRRAPMREGGPVPVGFEGADGDNPGLAAEEEDLPEHRFRFRFEKRGDLRFLSHLEVLRTFIRAAHRAGLRMAHTKGFHPHPKVVFSNALGVGVESLAEVVDITFLEADGPLLPGEVYHRLRRELPEGLRPRAAWRLEHGAPSSAHALSAAVYEIAIPSRALGEWASSRAEAAVAETLAADSIEFARERKGKVIRFDARPAIAAFEVAGENTGPDGERNVRLRLTLRYGEGATPKISEILASCLGLSPEDCLKSHVLKLAVRWKSRSARPMEHAL